MPLTPKRRIPGFTPGIMPIMDEVVAPELDPRKFMPAIAPPGSAPPPIVIEGDSPTVRDMEDGGRPQPISGRDRIPHLLKRRIFYPDSAFTIAAGGEREVIFSDYLDGLNAHYVRIEPSLSITVMLTDVLGVVSRITLKAEKPWYIKGMEFVSMRMSNANTSAVTAEVVFASSDIEVVEEQNINIIHDSPDVFTPLSVVLGVVAAAVTVNANYATLQAALLISDGANAGVISLGDAIAQVPVLNIGQSLEMSVRDLRNLFASSTVAGDTLHILVTRR